MKLIVKSVRIFLGVAILCGLLYPTFMTGMAQMLFPEAANGSLIKKEDTDEILGSKLIGQPFTQEKYLIGRPSEVSQQAPNSPELKAIVAARTKWFEQLDPENHQKIPSDLVMGSASGVDPNISPAAADYQVPRLAKERQVSEAEVRSIIKKYTKNRLGTIFGEPAVNVLEVNIALDQMD